VSPSCTMSVKPLKLIGNAPSGASSKDRVVKTTCVLNKCQDEHLQARQSHYHFRRCRLSVDGRARMLVTVAHDGRTRTTYRLLSRQREESQYEQGTLLTTGDVGEDLARQLEWVLSMGLPSQGYSHGKHLAA